MKHFACVCGNPLFFESTHCTVCGTDCGWCDHCRSVNSLIEDDGTLRCGNADCGVAVALCGNRLEYELCNCYFPAGESESGLCRSCSTTTHVPNLSVEGNLDSWRALEAAKRRLLYLLDILGLPYDEAGGAATPLTFQFLADTPKKKISTGHQNGIITINLKETKPVEREVARQQFDEPHRTLIGHFRHEVSHYYWMLLVPGQDEEAFNQLFGDYQDPPYGEAMPRYYEQGPPDTWAQQYISRYASSHPWEDFAETAAFYLDMCGVLDTVAHRLERQVDQEPPYDFAEMLSDYQRLGVIFNEVNRSMGLTDLLPEVVSEPVVEKLRYVHDLYAQRRIGVVAN